MTKQFELRWRKQAQGFLRHRQKRLAEDEANKVVLIERKRRELIFRYYSIQLASAMCAVSSQSAPIKPPTVEVSKCLQALVLNQLN